MCGKPLKCPWEKTPEGARAFPAGDILLHKIKGNCVNKSCPIGEVQFEFDFKPVEAK
jgi:hypothetical protein